MAEDSRIKTERNRVDKQKSLKKKNRENVQIKKLLKLLKSCCGRTFVIRKCIYLFLNSAEDDHNEVVMCLLTYHQQIN